MTNLQMLWISYLCVANAAHVIRDRTEKRKMWKRANRRADAFFLELERHPQVHAPWDPLDLLVDR